MKKNSKFAVEGIGRLEAGIMDTVWRLDKAVTVRDVYEAMRKKKSIAYTTVMTVMNNLAEKGYLAQNKADIAYIYTPQITRFELGKKLLAPINKLILGKRKAVIL